MDENIDIGNKNCFTFHSLANKHYSNCYTDKDLLKII